MFHIRVSALCLLARIALAQSYNLANGAHVTASSTYNSGPCSLYACGPHQVVNNIPNSIVDVGQWISNPGECDSDWRTSETSDISPVGRHNETLTIDWSANYGTQLISEVRFRYGSMAANPWGVQLIMYSQLPMNTAPIAVPIADASDWYAFTFLEPVTASGISLTWYGMQSRDNGKTCFVSIGNVEALDRYPAESYPNRRAFREREDHFNRRYRFHDYFPNFGNPYLSLSWCFACSQTQAEFGTAFCYHQWLGHFA
ncbi:hypothetical protein BDR26DRAFT_56139 [Obelidium mucronatum]|nr:hypothetical protein BDR26DRAFT_56139 [Obelidium mucronatum]